MRLTDEQAGKITDLSCRILALVDQKYTGEFSNEQLVDVLQSMHVKDDPLSDNTVLIYIIHALAIGIDALSQDRDSLVEAGDLQRDINKAFRKVLEAEKAHRKQLQDILAGRRILCD